MEAGKATSTKPRAKRGTYINIKVIQMYINGAGWSDAEEFWPDSNGQIDKAALKHDLQEYQLMRYGTRVITRRVTKKTV